MNKLEEMKTDGSDEFILMRQEDSDFYKSEMNCRQPARAEFFLDNIKICC